MRWNPGQYLKFDRQRLRPALDLIAQIQIESPANVYDLGCGTGNITRLLAERWPEARVVGVDRSPDMLAKAAADASTVEWRQGDIGSFSPSAPADVLFSNAALHWLDDHDNLFPRLIGDVAAGGVLAVQMPRNHGAPSHTLMADTARSGPWAPVLEPVLREAPVAGLEAYYDLLTPLAASVDIWETDYAQILEGEDAVFEWVRGTALKPLLDALDGAGNPDWQDGFVTALKARLNEAYPRRRDGKTLFSFRRLFIIAVK